MKMRTKRRTQAAQAVPWVALDTALAPIRQARVALLRNPMAVAEIESLIKRTRGPGARVLRQMLADDLKLLGQLERQEAAARRAM
jgi:hypothetical protein